MPPPGDKVLSQRPDPKRRDVRLALISAGVITTMSIGLFYLVFYRLVNFGFLTEPLGLFSLVSYPGMLPAFAIGGLYTGNLHTGFRNLGLILFVAIPLDLIFYFFVISLFLKGWAKLRNRTRLEDTARR